ncbi:MAG: alpha/beta hydrolase [Caldilineaceae bacterium]
MPQTALLTAQDYVTWPTVAPTARLAYGPNVQQFGDLYIPNSPPPHPVVIMLHGGCWQAQYNLEPLGEFNQALQREGLAVWSLEYRRLGNGGGWPNTFLDVAAGADYLREIADEYALDLDRVIVAGHSAGGHLALWLAARQRLATDSPLYAPNPLAVQGVLSLAGVADMTRAAQENLCGGAPQALLGGEPNEQPQRYIDGSPAALLPLGVAQILINGDRDHAVPLPYVQPYAEQARQSGDSVRLEALENTGHFEIVTPHSAVWPVVRNAVGELLAR